MNNNVPISLIVASLLLVAHIAWANAETAKFSVVETWKCYAQTDSSQTKVLVIAVRRLNEETNNEYGMVSAAGKEYSAVFEVNGFDRRWDFGQDSGYAFIIKPDGVGLYYDFSAKTEGVKPSQMFRCIES